MTRSEVVFKAIDIFFNPFQNYKTYPGMVREKEFVYDENFPECTAEVYYDPELIKKDEKLPVIVNIHGGGFVKGDKNYRRSLCFRYASLGYFVVNLNYRLSPKYVFPSAILDAVKGTNYVSVLAQKYNIDVNKVCVTGDSAGAYYATMVVAIANSKELQENLGVKEVTVKPAVLLSFCGPYDLVASITLTKLPFNLVWDIGHCFLDNEKFKLSKDFSNIKDYEYIDYVSPTKFVNKNWCPCFLVMSKKDIFCKGQGEILEKTLKECNVPVESFSSTKFTDNHCFHMDFGKKISKQCFDKGMAFVKKYL